MAEESSKVLATWKKYLKKKAAQGISSSENVSFRNRFLNYNDLAVWKGVLRESRKG